MLLRFAKLHSSSVFAVFQASPLGKNHLRSLDFFGLILQRGKLAAIFSFLVLTYSVSCQILFEHYSLLAFIVTVKAANTSLSQ